MSILVDYRPAELADIFGNKATVKSLDKILSNLDTANHAFLFTGAGGTGKSTLARIVANRLGVYNSQKASNPSYQEINTSDLRGIDTVREVIQTCKTTPMFCDRRVFFFDEAHQITPEAQEAFLHLLENSNNTPNWFIFATTEPDKLKATFKRRCITFELQPLKDVEMSKYLADICEKANLKITSNVIEQIIDNAGGSCGISLALLEKVRELSEDDALVLLSLTDSFKAQVIELCRALAKKKSWSEIALLLNGLRNEPPEKVRRAIMAYAANWLLKKENGTAFLIMDAFREPTFDTGFAQLVYAAYMARNV